MADEVTGPDRGIGARLYAASRYHARKAHTLATATGLFDQLDAVTHAGAAVELAAKALLADFDARLLPDRDAHHALLDAIAALRERQDVAYRNRKANRTVGAYLAIELAARLVPGCRQHQQAAKDVTELRNAAVHMAFVPSPEVLSAAITGMQAFTGAAAAHLRRSQDYWGCTSRRFSSSRKRPHGNWPRLRPPRSRVLDRTTKP